VVADIADKSNRAYMYMAVAVPELDIVDIVVGNQTDIVVSQPY